MNGRVEKGTGLYLPGLGGRVGDFNPHSKSNEEPRNGFQFCIMKRPFWMKEIDVISTSFQKHMALPFPYTIT